MKNIVTVGGGTGSYAVLSGLKNLPNIRITALVSMADDGGSTGILREKWGVMPPGDIRQCLAALSGREFLNHKINVGFWKGHKVGNIILAILEKITGNFAQGLEIVSKLLGVKGEIIPVTLDEAVLSVLLKDNTKVTGESNISDEGVKKIFYEGSVNLNPAARKHILDADFIIICPGSFYTSIVPNLIVNGFKESVLKSKAKIIAIENLGNQSMDSYTARIESYLGKSVDAVVPPDEALATEYGAVRHDPVKLAKAIEKIINS